MKRWISVALCLPCLIAVSCRRDTQQSAGAPGKSTRAVDPLDLALAPHGGNSRIDAEIIRLQREVRRARTFEASVERLGWAYVAKARESFDAGYYKLAEQCALALERRQPNCPEGLLLRGHVLHNLHRFKEAEPLAREVVSKRGLPFDFGLLSDVLMEQGKLPEAIDACQKMIDLRPDLHSYARGAHLRWLKGDVQGAESLMRLAADAASPQDPESVAWVNTRLAGYQFQLGAMAEAERNCALALESQKEYPPALLLKGRMLLARQKYSDAAELLRRAAKLNPLPEYQWALAETLRAEGQIAEAATVENELRRQGAAADPRTSSLYLATRAESLELALRLAQAELESRADVFTHDALAWSLAASGRLSDAREQMTQALADGTKDSRLFFHAAIISQRTGDTGAAKDYAAQAIALNHLLLPSERQQLANLNFPLAETLVSGSGADHKTNQ